MNKIELIHQLKQIAKDQGMTQPQIAEILNVSKGYVSNVMNSRQGADTDQAIKRIADAIGFELEIETKYTLIKKNI